MPGSFKIVGEHGKKIPLEQQFHRCPRCTHPSSVQLTRSEKQLVIFNKQIGKSSNMRVRYECKLCGWKNETLPDDPNELPPQHDDWYDDNGGNNRTPLTMGGRASEKQ